MTKKQTTAYLFFHCNLAFSSIEEEQRAEVIDRCYTPMLGIAQEYGIPLGVECTGWTLEEIARLRPQWLERFRALCAQGLTECIGSGYTQLIGPLVPSDVNHNNQRLGQQTYERLLGQRPAIALINEQAYSSGILEHYVDHGYTSILMEWDNPALAHPSWHSELRYAPQKVLDHQGRALDLVWVQSVVFQHLQRLVHGDLELDAYLNCLRRHVGPDPRTLCLYGNDAEVFNFRPGRFETEAAITQGEWQRMAQALCAARDTLGWHFCLPSQATALNLPHAGHVLELESPAQPVIVKKQPKYNLLRWAVTGRGDLDINTRCHRILHAMRAGMPDDADWRALCSLWASDLRTHITERRWNRCAAALTDAESKWRVSCPDTPSMLTGQPAALATPRWIDAATPHVAARLNPRKGLAVQALSFPSLNPAPVLGTISHGDFEDIAHAADFFTGHVVLEAQGERKRTDLAIVTPEMRETEQYISYSAAVPNFFCPMEKAVRLSKLRPEFSITYKFSWQSLPVCSIRLLHLTLLPDAYDANTLFFATHNGGKGWERFPLIAPVNHTAPVSFLVSASHALGMTCGLLRIGDARHWLEIKTDLAQAALVGMIVHQPAGASWLTRVVLSYREIDDTAKPNAEVSPSTVTVTVSAHSKEMAVNLVP